MMNLIYEGSVKNVYRDSENPDINYFEFSDNYSIFDWGKMPDTIFNKGRTLSVLGGLLFNELSEPTGWQSLRDAKLMERFDKDFKQTVFSSPAYQQLTQTGLKHHFLGWTDGNGNPLSQNQLAGTIGAPLMKVQAINVSRPRPFTIDRYTLFEYDHIPATDASRLIPLEVIFRFGMPLGSSLNKRLEMDPLYYTELGLSHPPEANAFFERPVIEFFTKLEPKDRFLSVQEAFLISGLTETQFKTLYDTTLLVALWLFNAFGKRGMELWDGKLEFGWGPEGLMLVDSIGPDELRLIYKGIHLSKETLRQFYRDTDWEKACREAKQLSLIQPGSDWKAICSDNFGQNPLPLTVNQKRIADNLYATLINHYMDSALFPTKMYLDELAMTLQDEGKLRETVGAA